MHKLCRFVDRLQLIVKHIGSTILFYFICASCKEKKTQQRISCLNTSLFYYFPIWLSQNRKYATLKPLIFLLYKNTCLYYTTAFFLFAISCFTCHAIIISIRLWPRTRCWNYKYHSKKCKDRLKLANKWNSWW